MDGPAGLAALTLQSAGAAALPGGYGVALLQTLLALAAVCVLAWAVLRALAAGGAGRGGAGRIEVLERAALDPRRALYLVKVGERVLLVGSGEGAAPTLLCELAAGELPPARTGGRFLDVLRGATGKGEQDAGPRPSEAGAKIEDGAGAETPREE